MTTDYFNDPLDCTRFVNLRPLAVGTYGQVYLAQDESNGKEVVIKKIAKNGDNMRVHNEIVAFERMPHCRKGIVSFHGFFESRNHIYLVFDRVKGNDLYNLMEVNGFQPLNEEVVKKIMRSTIRSLAYCHSNGVAHRDIKLENILVDSHSLTSTLIDFGLCSFFENFNGVETASSDFCGSLEYVPPEVFAQIPFAASKADAWSLGVTFFALTFGQFPFNITDNLSRGEENPYGTFTGSSISLPENDISSGFFVSEELRSLLSGLLKYDPAERITISSLASHPFFSKNSKSNGPLHSSKLPQEFPVESSPSLTGTPQMCIEVL